MPFVIYTTDLGKPMFFCHNVRLTGFIISNDIRNAKVYDSKKEAQEIAGALHIVTGMECQVKKK